MFLYTCQEKTPQNIYPWEEEQPDVDFSFSMS